MTDFGTIGWLLFEEHRESFAATLVTDSDAFLAIIAPLWQVAVLLASIASPSLALHRLF